MLLVISVSVLTRLNTWGPRVKKTSIICDVIRDVVGHVHQLYQTRERLRAWASGRYSALVWAICKVGIFLFISLRSMYSIPPTTGVQCSFLHFNPHRIVPDITVQGVSGENVTLESVDEVVESVCGQLPGSVQKYTPKVKRKKKKEKSFAADTELTPDSSTLSVKKFKSTSKKKKKKQTFDSLTNGQCNGDHEEAEVSCDVRFSSPALPRQFIMLWKW